MQDSLYIDDLTRSSVTDNSRKSRISYKKVTFVVIGFVITFLSLFWLNVYFLAKQKVSLSELITVLVFNARKGAVPNVVTDSLYLAPIQRAIWICLASVVAAVALVISGAVIQSLTQNPLADTTTLGFISSTIFGIILLKGVISNTIEASNYHIFYFLFALLGGIFTLFLLSFLFKKPQHKTQHLKIILIGLVLNMIFKTFTYLIKTYNPNAVNASFALAMGGAENIYGLYTSQFNFLKWCTIGLTALFAVTFLFSQKLNLFELGEEQAKTLGVNVKAFKHFGYALTLITTTIAIVLVGNIAFLGLICTHVVRALFKTRKYQIIIPIGSILAAILLLFGILLNSIFPFVSSSIFILFLGGCMLLFLTLKNDEL